MAALLAVAMMLQMLPMLAFAEDAAGTGEVWNKTEVWNQTKNKKYTSLVDAVEQASSGDTIELGEGSYTLYKKISDDKKPEGKDLTFVGKGPDKTTWQIGPEVPDPKLYGTEYNSDYSFQNAGTITFKNMKLCTGDKNYLGFTYIDKTVVDHCDIYGRTAYWGYTSAEFIDTTFYAPPFSLCDLDVLLPDHDI